VELISLLVEWLPVLIYEAYVDAFIEIGLISLVTGTVLGLLYLKFYE
jgi:hypothetical protein